MSNMVRPLAARVGLFSLLLLGTGSCVGAAGEIDAGGDGDGVGEEATQQARAALDAPLCVTIRRGGAGAVSDTFLSGDYPTWAPGSEPVMHTGRSGGGNQNHSLVRFDLSLLPAGTTVVSATGTVTLPWTATDDPVEVHQLLAPWSEGTATQASFGAAGDLDPTPTATFLTGSGGTKSFDLTALATGWANGSLPNHGLMLTEAPGDDSHHFWTSETSTLADRPGLTVCYQCAGACPASLCDGVVCGAQDACHQVGACDPATGQCTHPPVENGSACDDEDLCTPSSTCQDGVCTGASAVICDPLDQCHVAGACDPATGACSSPVAADGAACDDGNPCTQDDSCESGACAGSGPETCTCIDLGRGKLGDLHDAFLSGDYPGWATGGDPNLYTGLSGGGNLNRTLLSLDLGGAIPPASSILSATLHVHAGDSSAGTTVSVHAVEQPWSEGTVTGASFGPGGVNPAAVASFSAPGNGFKQADITPLVAGWYSGATANHGLQLSEPAAAGHSFVSSEGAAAQRPFVTVCYSELCAGVVCPAPDACHAAGTCDENTGLCSNPPLADGTACNDGNACTQSDTCQSGTCTGANPVICLAPDPCHEAGVCDPMTGSCSQDGAQTGTTCGGLCGPCAPGPMSVSRAYHTATLLPSGKVLVAGGYGPPGGYLASAELYDAATGTFSATGSMIAARYFHTATLLPSGKVLVAGGYSSQGGYLASAELYDAATKTFSAAPTMGIRAYHTATLLQSGKVLMTGGASGGTTFLSSARLYDPSTNTFSAAGSMSSARFHHTATLLPSGKVLVAGGYSGNGVVATAELYNPATNTFSAAGSIGSPRAHHSATLLPSGKVLLAGGITGATYIAGATLYDPATSTFSATGSMITAHGQHTATLLQSGDVLITAGNNGSGFGATTERYNAATATFTAAGSVSAARIRHTATLLQSGDVLITGGYNGTYLAGAELYSSGW